MSSITLNDMRDYKNIVKADATIVCRRMGKRTSATPRQERLWKRSIESDIARLRKDLSSLDDWFTGKWKKYKKRKDKELRKKYEIKIKGFKVVILELEFLQNLRS